MLVSDIDMGKQGCIKSMFQRIFPTRMDSAKVELGTKLTMEVAWNVGSNSVQRLLVLAGATAQVNWLLGSIWLLSMSH